jgi:hypothetical protein
MAHFGGEMMGKLKRKNKLQKKIITLISIVERDTSS